MAAGLRQHGYFLWVCTVLLVGLVLNLVGLNEILHAPVPPVHPAWAFPIALMCAAITGALCQHILGWGRGYTTGQGLRTLRLLFQLVVLGWLGFLAFSESFSAFKVSLTLGLVVGLLAWGLLLRTLARRPLLAKGIRIGDVVLTNLCVIVVGLELGMRLIGAVSPTPVLARTQEEVVKTLETYRYPPNHVRYGFPCNSTGHYDTEFESRQARQAGRPLILSIGDSFSAGVVPHYFHFTTVLERELGSVDVYNMGIPCTDPPAYLHLWKTEGQQLEPDLLVINVFVGNDVAGSWGSRMDYPGLRSWFDRTQVFLFFVPERLQKIVAENKRLAALGRKAGELQGEQGRPIIKQDMQALAAAYPWLGNPMLEEQSFSEEEYTKLEAARAHDALLRPWHYYKAMFDVLAEIQSAVQGTPWMVVMIPDEFQVNDELWKKVLAIMGRPEADRFRPQRWISRWLQERGIPCLDLLPRLRAVMPMADGRRHLYHLQDTHFNARGNEVAGKAMAGFIREHFAGVLR